MDLDYSKILDDRSREYFKEAVTCSEHGCYRAAMSTLYCVCMCDIVYKLIGIGEEHGFTPASDILNEMRDTQKTNPRREAWENQLLESVVERTALLDDVTYKIILQIRDWRHLSAHPALDDENKLVTPNQEMVIGHLREIYSRLLTKSPIYVKSRDLPALISDMLLQRRVELMKDNDVFESFLEKEYNISKLSEKDVLRLFKTFWKFELSIADKVEAEYTRIINARFIAYLYQQHTELINQHFSVQTNHLKINRELWQEAHYLFSKFPAMYNFLDDIDKILINHKVHQHKNDFLAFAWYLLNGNKEEHIQRLIHDYPFLFHWYNLTPASKFRNKYKAEGLVELCDKYFISKFTTVQDFTQTGHYYYNFLQPNIGEWTLGNCELFFSIVTKNNQIYNYQNYQTICEEVAQKALTFITKEQLLSKFDFLTRILDKQ